MTTEKITLDELMSRNPFRVPEGYFEGFAGDLMQRLPQKAIAPKVSLFARMKPWLYMAAAFAGIVVLFNVLNKPFTSPAAADASAVVLADEDEEFMDYLQDMYADKYALSYIDYYNYE